MLTHRTKWMKSISLLVIFGVLLGMLPAPGPVSASPEVNPPIEVNDSGDSPDADGGVGVCETSTGNGKCTLRAAIETAEYQTGADVIVIDPSIVVIGVGSSTSQALPPLGSGNLTIKGNNTLINGQNAPSGAHGFELSSDNNKIQGLVIYNFKDGIHILDGSNNVIGTDGDGVDDANEGNQIVTNSRHGVYIWGSNNRVSGNLIGTNGTTASPNNSDGVHIYSGTGNLIGTDGDGVSDTAERNVISGNLDEGVEILSSYNTVAGNYIGTDKYGTSSIENIWDAVLITNGGAYNVIGTNGDGQGDLAEGNLISGNFRKGVAISGTGTVLNKVAGNIIGLDVSGSVALPNGAYNVSIGGGAAYNYIGTDNDGQADKAERNVISGNSDYDTGVYISGDGTTGNEVAGNYIGTNAAGDGAIGNSMGIRIYGASGNTIGGTGTWSGNLISGNEDFGIHLDNGADNNTVIGNLIGTNRTGMSALPNGSAGIRIEGSGSNEIGGTSAADRNVISGNSSSGVSITGAASTGNLVQGNYIGVAANSITALGNTTHGIAISGSAHDNTVGGVDAGAGNTIAYNGGDGVYVGGDTSIGNSIRGNAIYNNNELGIDLVASGDSDGPTDNDGVGDDDEGANEYQDYPVLTEVEIRLPSGYLGINGVLSSTQNTDFVADFYLNKTCDPSGYGEGWVYLRSMSLPGRSSGVMPFIPTFEGSYTAGHYVTVTATDEDGNTSEFSPCYEIVMECRELEEVRIVGDTSGYPGDYTFTTVIIPTSADEPISYLWDNGDTDSISTRSLDVGSHKLTVTASNCDGTQVDDDHKILINEPPATCAVPLTGVTISGPTSGITDTTYTFSATIEPSDATTPVTYNWTPEPDSGQGSTSATYSWDTAGEKIVAINAQNCGGARSDRRQNNIEAGTGPEPEDEYFIYLPVVVR